MVVLGAGASFDSVPREDWAGNLPAHYQPPLARELFDAVRRPKPMGEVARKLEQIAGGGLGGMVGRLAALVKGDADGLEAELGRLQDRADRDAVTARQMHAVRFYIREVVERCAGFWMTSASQQTNYAALLNWVDEFRRDAADDEPVLWVNFNYDLMLETAANQVLNHTLDRVEQHVADPRHAFIKPHGSTNWVRAVEFEGSGATGQAYEAVIRATEIRELSDVIDVDSAAGRPTIPALAVPIADKATFECPELHYRTLESLIPHVDRVLTIGWRGREAHFLKMCRDGMHGRAAVTVVDAGSDEATAIAQHLWDNLGSVEVMPSRAEGFSAFLSSPGALQAAWEGRPPSEAEAEA